MSKKTVFATLDAAAGIFGHLLVFNHSGEAVRAFTDQVNRASDDNFMNKYAEHYALYEIGTYDDTTGIIFPLDLPKLTVQAASVKNTI